jgi:hypothetical protein
MKFIHIFKDGKMDEITYNEKKINEKKLIKYFNKISKSQGSSDIKKLYSWDYDGSLILCYGWYDGENGFENKHGLTQSGTSDFIDEDSSLKKLYGDIFILRYDKKYYSDITICEYSMFYSNQYEDYSDYDSDSLSEGDLNSDIENDDNLDEDYEIIEECDGLIELEYDNNDY